MDWGQISGWGQNYVQYSALQYSAFTNSGLRSYISFTFS